MKWFNRDKVPELSKERELMNYIARLEETVREQDMKITKLRSTFKKLKPAILKLQADNNALREKLRDYRDAYESYQSVRDYIVDIVRELQKTFMTVPEYIAEIIQRLGRLGDMIDYHIQHSPSIEKKVEKRMSIPYSIQDSPITDAVDGQVVVSIQKYKEGAK